ncbi:hypothetical protein [Shinella sp.]|uniref:hypothetical protein n=1 Tax=Shinella sp. TaxID=1870904 RepID=UPI00301DB0D7
MEFIIILAVLAWAAYKLFKLNTAMGAETVRAFLYLEALLEDYTTQQASALSARDLLGMDTSVLQGIMNEIQRVHGKQMPLIAEAYRRGMQPMLPTWYRGIVTNAPALASVEIVYSAPLTMKDRQTHNRTTQPVEALKARATPPANASETFEAYYDEFLHEIKRLSGKASSDLHFIEMMEDEPLRRAFFDGVDPKALAFMLHSEYANRHGF